jgi:hypothetical protein
MLPMLSMIPTIHPKGSYDLFMVLMMSMILVILMVPVKAPVLPHIIAMML